MRFLFSHRPKALIVMLSAWLLMTSTSCSRNKTDLQKAEQLESQEKWDEALAIYSPLVSRTPASRTSELAELQSHIGHCLIELGRGTDALMALEQAISLDSSNINAHLRMAQLFVLASAPDKAEPHLEYVAQRLPDDPEMLAVRAAMYAAEDRDELAEHDFDRALALGKNDETVPERAAQFYLDENKPEKARSILMESASHDPRSSGLSLTLARLDETEGETAKAELEYRRAVALDDSVGNNTRLAQFLARNGRIDEAGAVLRHADVLSSKLSISFADLQLQSGRTREALQAYQSAYESLQKNELADNSAPAKNAAFALSARLVETNLALASQGDASAVIASRNYLQGTAGNLDGNRRSLLRAEISLLSGDLANSEQIAKSFVDDSKSKAAAQYLLGEVAVRRGRREEAIEHWQAALDTDSNYVPARIALATEAIQRQNGNEAENWITPVVREEPANVNALLAYARALLLQKRYESAAALCERARMVDPRNAQIPMLSGQIALGQNQLAVALLEFEKAMLLDPYSERALEGLTAVYEAGNSDEALLRKLENLAQNGTPSSRLMEVAGRLYAWRGEYSNAIRCLRRAAQMDPYRKTARVALARIYVDQQPNARAQELLARPELQSFRQEKQEFPLLAATGAESRGDQAEAMRQYEATVEAGDPSGIASNNLAWIYVMQGKHLDRALKLAQHALEANPDSPQVLDTLGMIQLQNRKFSEAIALFQRAIRRASELKGMDSVQRTIEAHLSQALQVSGVRTSS